MSDLRRCPRCEDDLPLTAFSFRDAARTRPQSYCRECQNEAWRAWYNDDQNRERHKASVRDRRKRRHERHRQMVIELKSVPCADCGQEFPPHVMDFDHLDDKTAEVSAMVHTMGTEALLAEIAKCDVVCANCHRIRTHNRAEERRSPE